MKALFIALGLYSLLLAEMVTIPGGTFTMGGGTKADEKPAHKVTVSTFKLDKHEVTNAEYEKCVKSGRCKPLHYTDGKCYVWSKGTLKKIKKVTNPAFTGPDKPAVCVDYRQARAYCKAQGKRLPTEAEWEYAATKAGTQKYSGGSLSGKATYKTTAPVDANANMAGAYGLKNMNGNVWEWVYDQYEHDYYKISPETNPKGGQISRFRSVRGGGWYSGASDVRSRNRHKFAPEAGEVSIGFRCAK